MRAGWMKSVNLWNRNVGFAVLGVSLEGGDMKRKASTRSLIEPHKGDKRYIRRDPAGRIKKEVNVGRSLAMDRRSHSKTVAKPGQGRPSCAQAHDGKKEAN